jgi:hypothetical protein
VKRITVKPGVNLSVRMHHHRAEHWVVVSGTAKVTNGEDTALVCGGAGKLNSWISQGRLDTGGKCVT